MAGRVTVKFDRAHLTARFKAGKIAAGKKTVESIIANSGNFVPYAEGTLKTSAEINGPQLIGDDYAAVWDEVYAAYQYYGCWPDGSHVIKNHNLDVNPNATTQWVEAAKRIYGDNWLLTAQREFVAGAGG